MTIVIADGRGALWQWDTGRRVKITDGADVKQIHYQKRCFGRSVDVDVEDDGTAIIPDELLQDYHTLTAYAYVTDDAGGYTKVQQDFAVYKRAKPAGYVYTPTDQMTLQTIQRQIGDLADLTTKEKENLVAAINEAAASCGAGSSVQSDWNQNDYTQPDYVKNRPFYTGDPVETVLVEESTVPFTENHGVYIVELKSTFSATVGETYKVSWDGTVYECTCVDFSDMIIIGNLSIMGAGSDTGEPFLMSVYNGQEIVIFTADTSASHTFSISGIVTPIVKIPAKYIDKGASGYIVVHNSSTMTEEEAKNYVSAISKGESVFIIWNDICIKFIQFDEINNDILFITQNDETYLIKKNNDGLFAFSDRKFYNASFPSSLNAEDEATEIYANQKKIVISSSKISSGVGSTDVLFKVDPNGMKSKAFDVLGNGEAVTPAIILYSSTADSTKKFKITVDDSGTLTATEITA